MSGDWSAADEVTSIEFLKWKRLSRCNASRAALGRLLSPGGGFHCNLPCSLAVT